jgi:hypothetical protein
MIEPDDTRIKIVKVDWAGIHSARLTGVAKDWLDVYVFLQQFRVMPPMLVGIRETAYEAVSHTLVREQMDSYVSDYREAHPEPELRDE